MRKSATHRFTLILAGISEVDEEMENRVFEAGCDDGLLAIRDGVVFLDFDREAETFAAGLSSAVQAVERAGLRVARIEPDDLVNQSQVAGRLGRTRESVRLLISGARGPGSFPTPVSGVKGNMRLWRWSQVAQWLAEHSLIELAEAERAAIIAELNAALELRASARIARPRKAVRDLLKGIQAPSASQRARSSPKRKGTKREARAG